MAQALAPEKRLSPADYSGVERAAIVMLSLGDQATNLLRHLDEDELREISSAMSSLGMVPASVVDSIISEFFSKLSEATVVVGSMEQAERLLLAVLPEDRVAGIMAELRGPAGRSVWDKVSNVNATTLARYLANEYPQTVAFVLSKIPANVSASVLAALPHEFAIDVITRMLNLDAVSADIQRQLEKDLRSEFIGNLSRVSRRDNHEAMAEIFNSLDRRNESRLLSMIDNKAHDSADRIRALMFVFDDLSKLDAAAVQTLLRGIDKADLALALKGASATMRDLFLGNMSARGAKLLHEDMQSMGAVRMRDVDAAQTRIVALAKELSARGEILLAGNSAEDELIY